jgi:hypothetical protein
MILRGASRTLLVAFIAIAFGSTGCDKLGLGGKKSDESSSSDDDSSSKKKKKKKKKSDDEDTDEESPSASATASAAPTATATASATAAPTASASAAPSASAPEPEATGDVKRYPDETPDHGDLSITKASPAHKEATTSSEVVITLQPGSAVQRVAKYQTWQLVSWKNKSGEHFGWIDNRKTTTLDHPDAGPTQIEGLDRRDAGVKPVATPDAGKK